MIEVLKENDRTKEILELTQKGYKRKDLAKKYGHSDFKSVDMYMYRRNYKWDPKIGTYIKKEKDVNVKEAQEVHTGKAKQIIDLFDQGLDAKSVAKQLLFQNHHVVADFMLNKGYKWSTEKRNYIKIIGVEQGGEINLEGVQNYQLNGGGVETVPRFLIPGLSIGKNIHISHLLNDLVIDFSQQKNIKQREIFEVAIIEFLQKYGFVHEIKALFQD